MKPSFTITIHQTNPFPGDFKRNLEKALQGVNEAIKAKSNLLIFPAQSLTGMEYNLLFKREHFLKEAKNCLDLLINHLKDSLLKVLITCPIKVEDSEETVFLLSKNGAFDLNHSQDKIIEIDGQRILIFQDEREDHFQINNIDSTPNTLLVHLNTRPFYRGIQLEREKTGAFISKRTGNNFLEVNRGGTTDHLVYYGGSFLTNPSGKITMRAKSFNEDVITFELNAKKENAPVYGLPDDMNSLFEAITQSIKDYINKNGFKKVLIGLSGGLDSALVTTLAVEALGRENVFCLLMPSQFSSQGSLDDSQKLAKNLGIKTAQIPITSVYQAVSNAMSNFFGERTFNTTDENIQARIRCVYLMATSNEYGYVVLNTGNKSETATGYSTLYGDTIGGYAPISDLYKTDCYKLAAFINMRKGYAHIPTEILKKAPSAELAPGQTDQDSLPPYEVLDGILACILEQNLSVQEIVDQGYPEETVKKTAQLLRINEYKRRQEPMGPRLSKSSFVHDLNLPVTNGFRG
ncbi:MAG: NAD(+) synthase [Thermotogota bacterium]|nr:NAD(+) synthase [Thermotogota bacterium]